MTKQREWPNNQARYRDRSAEEVSTSITISNRLLKRVEVGEFTRNGLERDLLRIIRHLQIAARHLEKAGAQTEPE